MSTLNATATANWGEEYSSSATYTTARAGNVFNTTSDGRTGQRLNAGTYDCYELFVEFDLTTIPAGSTINSATLSIYGHFNDAGTAFTLNARQYDFGTSVTSADYIAGASLSGNTLLAHIASGSITYTQYDALTNDGLVTAVGSQAGSTLRMVFCSSRLESGTAPTADEYTTPYVTATNPIKLDVDYTAPSTGGAAFAGGGFFG